MTAFFHTILYVPIYNLLIFFVDAVPHGDVGLAVILVTLVVKLILTPFSINAMKTQRRMKFVEPQIKEIKEKYKDSKEKQALETMALYKNNGIKPFSSIFGTLLQLPVIICLYLVFRHEHLLAPNQALIYHFVTFPTQISPFFLGVFPTTGHVIVLAAIAAVFQFIQGYLTIPVPAKSTKGTAGGSEDFARALSLQTRFLLPIIIAVVAYTAGALALYFITSSIVAILQEYYVRYQLRYLKTPETAQ